jgi:hypothetical protein
MLPAGVSWPNYSVSGGSGAAPFAVIPVCAGSSAQVQAKRVMALLDAA